jgi:hypothetical protein
MSLCVYFVPLVVRKKIKLNNENATIFVVHYLKLELGTKYLYQNSKFLRFNTRRLHVLAAICYFCRP